MTNSRYLAWFHQIEKELWKFFALFDDLCGSCARLTLDEARSGRRDYRERWCCCMIDNQVHDNWEALNANQSRSDRNWYAKLEPQDLGRRMPGNGPCPALGENGCRLKKLRPITCTTQLCRRMLHVLNELDVVKCSTYSALQIEDLIELPDILPSLYGTARRPRRVLLQDVESYINAVRDLRHRLSAVADEERGRAIAAAATL